MRRERKQEDDIETKTYRNNTLFSLYENGEYDYFFGLLIELDLNDYYNHVMKILCSQSTLNINNIKFFFMLCIVNHIEYSKLFQSIQKNSRKADDSKQRQIEMLKCFHASEKELKENPNQFKDNYEQMRENYNANEKNWSQLTSYPAVHIKQECSLCQKPLTDAQQILIYPCGHGEHVSCRDEIEDTSVICRQCKSNQLNFPVKAQF